MLRGGLWSRNGVDLAQVLAQVVPRPVLTTHQDYNGDRSRGAFELLYIDEDMSPLIFGSERVLCSTV